MGKLRILLADDHETVRDGIRAIVNAQSDMEIVGEAVDGQGAITQTIRHRPDVVVMDVSMPGVNGVKATESIREWCPAVKVVTLSRHADDAYVQRLLRAGASGYVLKQSRTAELLHAIRAVAAGGSYFDSTLAARLVGGYRRRPTAAPRGMALSTREEQVLRLVAWGYSNKDIAAQLDLSVKTIETHKSHAMQKLELSSRIDVVRYALLQGWLEDE